MDILIGNYSRSSSLPKYRYVFVTFRDVREWRLKKKKKFFSRDEAFVTVSGHPNNICRPTTASTSCLKPDTIVSNATVGRYFCDSRRAKKCNNPPRRSSIRKGLVFYFTIMNNNGRHSRQLWNSSSPRSQSFCMLHSKSGVMHLPSRHRNMPEPHVVAGAPVVVVSAAVTRHEGKRGWNFCFCFFYIIQ